VTFAAAARHPDIAYSAPRGWKENRMRLLSFLAAVTAVAALGVGPAGAQGVPIDPYDPPTLIPPPPAAPEVKGKVIKVGPNEELKRIGEAAKVARNGDIVEIAAGNYPGDVALWPQSDITIRAVGGRAVIKALGRSIQNKAIFVLDGNNVTIENIEFAEARVADRNGAGIRAQGTNPGTLRIVNCLFRDSENSILAADNLKADLVVLNSEFSNLGEPQGKAHGLYIGRWRSVTVIGSYFHDTLVGHHIKSRASVLTVAYSRLTAEEGNPSYEIEVTDGGLGYIVGNLIEQGKKSDNSIIIAQAVERGSNFTDNRLFVVNNTIVNALNKGIFVMSRVGPVTVANNILVGGGTVLDGQGVLINNLMVEMNGGTPAVTGGLNSGRNRGNVVGKMPLADTGAYDYRIKAGGPAAGQGIDAAKALNVAKLKPEFIYVHPLGLKPRPAGSVTDIGAYPAGG
jgi:hypothetical protein